MRRVKRVILVLMFVIIALVVLAFVLENQQQVSLSFLGFSTPETPVSVFVVIAMVVGLIFGPLLVDITRRSAPLRRPPLSQ